MIHQPFFHEMCKRYWCFSKRYWVTAESPMGADQRFPSGPLQFASGPKGPLGPLWKKGCYKLLVLNTHPSCSLFAAPASRSRQGNACAINKLLHGCLLNCMKHSYYRCLKHPGQSTIIASVICHDFVPLAWARSADLLSLQK